MKENKYMCENGKKSTRDKRYEKLHEITLKRETRCKTNMISTK